jgi:hypothetical protein
LTLAFLNGESSRVITHDHATKMKRPHRWRRRPPRAEAPEVCTRVSGYEIPRAARLDMALRATGGWFVSLNSPLPGGLIRRRSIPGWPTRNSALRVPFNAPRQEGRTDRAIAHLRDRVLSKGRGYHGGERCGNAGTRPPQARLREASASKLPMKSKAGPPMKCRKRISYHDQQSVSCAVLGAPGG